MYIVQDVSQEGQGHQSVSQSVEHWCSVNQLPCGCASLGLLEGLANMWFGSGWKNW